MLSIGIDIGGTKILGAIVDDNGRVISEKRVSSPAKDPDLMVNEVASLILELSTQVAGVIAPVGVAAAGFIDSNQANVLYAPNLSWRDEPLRERIQEKIQRSLVIENDANAAGWAEYRFGAGRGSKDMVMLTLGTGVGGAVISDGAIRRGGFGIAGELGHIRVVRGGKQCGCGRTGCVEQYASGTLSLLRDVGAFLGEAMGSITAALDPQVYVIGGGLSEAGELLLEPIRESFLRELPAQGFRPVAKILAASFSNQAGVIGAADLARESLR